MRAPAQIITVSLYCQAPGDTKLDLEAGHNLPIEPLFVSDMAMATHRVLGKNMTLKISTRIGTS